MSSTVPPEEGSLSVRHILVSGKVQGVFFRKYTQIAAREIGVTGWVRNLSDGRVEITAEGTEEQIASLEQWCHKGSPKSRVQAVVGEEVTTTTTEANKARRFSTFEIVA